MFLLIVRKFYGEEYTQLLMGRHMAMDFVREIQNHITTGRALLDSQNPAEAVKEFEEAQKLARSIESPRTELLSTLFLISALSKEENRLEVSEAVFEVQTQIKSIVDFPPAFMPFINNIAADLHQSQPDEAIILWKNALELARTFEKPEWEEIILSNIAHGYFSTRNYDKAVETFLKVSELLEDKKAIENLENAAAIFKQIGENKKALELMQLVVEQYNELKLEDMYIKSLQVTGELAYRLHSETEDSDLASKYLQNAIRSFRQAKDKFQLSNVLYMAGIHYQQSQREDMALECWRMAQEYALESKNIEVATKSLVKLALVDLSGEKIEQSIKRLQNAQKLAHESGDSQTSEALTRLINTVLQKAPDAISLEGEELLPPSTPTTETPVIATTEKEIATNELNEDIFSFGFPDAEKDEIPTTQPVSSELVPTPESLSPPSRPDRTPQVGATLESSIAEARTDITGLLNQRRNEVANYLRSKGYSVELHFRTSGMAWGGTEITPDVVAKKRRKKIFVVFASDPADAGIASFLLRSVHERGRKLIFLISGDPAFVQTARDIRVINRIEMLPI